jgi:predicted DNA-binding transcriptional regulator AlpA
MNDNSTPLLDERRAAAILGWAPRTLAQRRFDGTGPQYVRLSPRAIRYRLSDLQDYVEGRLYHSTAEYAP